jgi:hypothetical protein
MTRSVVVAVVALALGAGCARERWVGEPVPLDAIAIDQASLVVKTGTVGAGEWQRESSYVLVSARNSTDRDLLVTLRGQLIDGAARRPLMPESLRLPAGGERLFALVDQGQVARPGAAGAEIEVAGALAVDYPPPVAISDGNVYQDQGRAVVAAHVANSGKGEATAAIIAAFYDAAGKPMERPFTTVKLTGGGKRGVQLVGPPGSASAQMYVGEVQY